MIEMPHPEHVEVAFTFARCVRDPDFRRYVTSLAPKGRPIVCTRAGEDPAALAARVDDTLRDHPGYDTALVVALDATQRWGLRIEAARAALSTPPDTDKTTA